MKTLKNILVASFIASVLFATISCEKSAEWTTDYSVALEKAKAENKSIALLFTGNDWDPVSKDAYEKIYNAPTFKSKLAKNFILAQIDIPATNDEEEISDDDWEKYMLLQSYAVQNLPTLFVVSSCGLPVEQIDFDIAETHDPNEIASTVNSFHNSATKLSSAFNSLESATGIARVNVINEIYENISRTNVVMINELIQEAISLDPNNESGYLGKFKLQQAYPEAMIAYSEGDIDSAIESFIGLLEGDILSQEEKQEALYVAAYFQGVKDPDDLDEIKKLLQQAYDVAPKSKQAEEIATVLKSIAEEQAAQ